MRKRFILPFILLIISGVIVFTILLGPRQEVQRVVLPTPRLCSACWKPLLETAWQWQLTALPVDTSLDVAMYDIDLFENDSSVVSALHDRGIKVVCYMNAGAWEDWRPDADQFPDSIKGNENGWPGEKWLDIRRLDILVPIMESRLDLCKSKGFDGIEPDNIDGYINSSGFPLTYQDQLSYNISLANAAHARGLSIGLKNDIDQVHDLAPYFDWALTEQCFQFQECDQGINSLVENFIAQDKAVFHVEYNLFPNEFCTQTNAWNFNSMKKDLSLDVYREACR